MVELMWEGKYDANGKRVARQRITLPFQDVETVNESVQQRQLGFDMFSMGRARDWRNRLIWGDKKYVLPSLLAEFAGQVKLIYIDPPFATGDNFSATVEVEGEDVTREPNALERKAYRDIWGAEDKDSVKSLDTYARWFYETTLLLYDLLADEGSIYVHCDYRVNSMARMIMNEVFGPNNFLGEIIWRYRRWPAKTKNYQKMHDVIFYYTKNVNTNYVFNTQYEPLAASTIQTWGTKKQVADFSTGHRKPSQTEEETLGAPLSDVWDIGVIAPISAERVGYPTQKPEALLERIIKASSNEGDLVLDCFAGSGTTAAVAEKLGRRWITADFGRFAIHTTRKRLLGIANVRPFVVQNLGKYERQRWQAAEFGDGAAGLVRAYTEFILKLYHAQAVAGNTWLHGVKDGRFVHVGAVDAPVTPDDVREAIAEWKLNVGQLASQAGQEVSNTIDFLGWEFALDMNETTKQAAKASGVEVNFVCIPYEVLDKKALAQQDIQFFELAALDASATVKGRALTLQLNNFVLPPSSIPEAARQELVAHVGNKWDAWIDYWAVDWDYKGDTFHNQWQDYRTKKKRDLQLQVTHEYEQPGRYVGLVKVIDVFGNDTTKSIEIEVR